MSTIDLGETVIYGRLPRSPSPFIFYALIAGLFFLSYKGR